MAAPDYRSDKMDSLEGLGVARARWSDFHDSLPDEVWEDIYEAEVAAGLHEPGVAQARDNDEDVPEEVLEALAREVVEESELLGFWLAWHLAGGFANLQRAGWHRATIHRKISRFRSHFGRHPDEFRLPWLRLDLQKAWKQRIVDAMHPKPVEEPLDI
jgi:hypothetical protein